MGGGAEGDVDNLRAKYMWRVERIVSNSRGRCGLKLMAFVLAASFFMMEPSAACRGPGLERTIFFENAPNHLKVDVILKVTVVQLIGVARESVFTIPGDAR
jgi:hypothetical protein